MLEPDSIEEAEIFTEQKRLVYFKKEEKKSVGKSFKQNLLKKNTKESLYKNFLTIIIVLIILEPVLIWTSISIADTMLKYNPHYLATPPTFFIFLFFSFYIISDDLVLYEVLPSLREEKRIALFPKAVYFTILFGISFLVVMFSIIKYGNLQLFENIVKCR